MVSVRPVRTEEKEKDLCVRYQILPGYDCLYLTEENDAEAGWFTLRQEKSRVVILRLEVCGCGDYEKMDEDQRYLTELMVRTGLSYAMNRGLDMLACVDTKLFSFLRGFRFEEKDGILEIPVAKMTHTCGECK